MLLPMAWEFSFEGVLRESRSKVRDLLYYGNGYPVYLMENIPLMISFIMLWKSPHTKTLCLNTSEETYLPIETVFLTALKRDSSTLFTNPISSGLSFYTNKEVASIKGIFEVIERDALMYWWHTNLQSTTEINIYNSVNKWIIDRIYRILEVGLRIRLLNISRFPEIPVVLCVISGKSYPYAGFGISCNASMISAICKSIDESVSIRTMSHWARSSEKVDCNNFDWVQELPDHMHLYAN